MYTVYSEKLLLQTKYCTSEASVLQFTKVGQRHQENDLSVLFHTISYTISLTEKLQYTKSPRAPFPFLLPYCSKQYLDQQQLPQCRNKITRALSPSLLVLIITFTCFTVAIGCLDRSHWFVYAICGFKYKLGKIQVNQLSPTQLSLAAPSKTLNTPPMLWLDLWPRSPSPVQPSLFPLR